jgi:DNA invertase Pin-like site-specific DNA recombinase
VALVAYLSHMEQFIAYFRCSTQRQGLSGLGLDAQRNSVLSFLNNRTILAEFTDVESGKNDHRPELLKAIELAKQTNSTLLIAKLDRLSRNLTFVSTLMDTKVKFICADMPDANELTIHIFGALAQWERKKISSRTKDALQQLKKRKKLGTPENFTDAVRQMGPRKRTEIANSNANNQKARKVINLLNKNGKSLREIAIELNEAGFKTSKGNQFGPEQVRRLISKVAA